MENLLQETDNNGKPYINPSFYYNAIKDTIPRIIEQLNYNPDKINPNQLLAIYRHTQKQIFKVDKPQFNNYKCNIPYSTHNIKQLLDIYITICNEYGFLASLYGFETMTGIDNETVRKYVTDAGSLISNYDREIVRNNLSITPVGNIALANNDSLVGLEYEKKNTIERETVRQGLQLQELPRLTKKQ